MKLVGVVLTECSSMGPTAKLIHPAKETKPKYQLLISPKTRNGFPHTFNILFSKTLIYDVRGKYALGIQ